MRPISAWAQQTHLRESSKQASSSAQIHAMANTPPTRSFRFVPELEIDLSQSSHHPPPPPPPLLSSPLLLLTKIETETETTQHPFFSHFSFSHIFLREILFKLFPDHHPHPSPHPPPSLSLVSLLPAKCLSFCWREFVRPEVSVFFQRTIED